MAGYIEGPTLANDVDPWPLGWEWEWGWNADEPDKRRRAVRIDDGHPHEWERCLLLADGPRRYRDEHVVRCAVCHVPRCGHSGDEDPCMERRHHKGLHIYLSGRFEPLGGILACEVPGCRHTAAWPHGHGESA